MRNTMRLSAAIIGCAVLASAFTGSVLAQDDVSGSIEVSGSSTVEPISSFVAAAFAPQFPNVTVSVDGPGTTSGFELFCNGDTDISDASRPIKDVEVEACDANGIQPVELKVGIDGLAVIVSQQNDTIECLNFLDLYAIFGVESDDISTWEDAAAFAAQLGSDTESWPSGALSITAPGDESGTWGSFIEITLEDLQAERVGEDVEPNTRKPGDIYVASPNDLVIIDGVGNNPSGIGFVGFAFAVNNQDRVRMVPISAEPGGECISPDPETVAANTYPISRDLFIYADQDRVDPSSDRSNPAVVPFVDYYLSDEGIQNVSAAGYVQLSPEALEETRAAWESAKSAAGA